MEKNIKPASDRFFYILIAFYLAEFAIFSINPVDRTTWWVENATVWIILAGIITARFRGARLSKLAYLLMFVLVFLHTIGGHYTFAKVPFDWFTKLFGLERDNFDRVAHFSVGFYAFAFAEWLIIKKSVRSMFVLISYPIFAIMAIAAAYEIFEMAYAIAFGGQQAADYLGSQGDVWDAQKDMLSDTLGGIAAMIIFYCYYGKRNIRAMLAK